MNPENAEMKDGQMAASGENSGAVHSGLRSSVTQAVVIVR